MQKRISENILNDLSAYVANHLALYFPRDRWNDLERNIKAAAAEFGYHDPEDFIRRIIQTPLTREYADILASHLTINETYFWREPQSFHALAQQILPHLIDTRRKGNKSIRLWSAGCSGGEEPYSIAIALRRAIPDIDEWNINILATDINPKILQKANAGIYGTWSFRNAPKWLSDGYFLPVDGNKLAIIPEIKKMVRFEYLNLADDIFPSSINNTNAMDVIFCRNVLMYFSPERTKKVVQGLYNALVDGGYLIVGASELSYQNFSQFGHVNFEGGMLYSKNNRSASKSPSLPSVKVPMKIPEKMNLAASPKMQPVIPETIHLKNKTEDLPVVEVPELSKYEEAFALYSKGRYAEVISALENFAESPEDWMLLIRAFANQGKLAEAIATCGKTIAISKLNPLAHYLCATILLENNQPEEAILSLKRALYLDPDFVLSYFTLGNIFLRQGNKSLAKKNYKNVLSILEKNNMDEILPASEGLTVGRLKEIVNFTMQTRGL